MKPHCLLLAAAYLLPATARAADHDTQLWTTATLTVPVASGFSAYGEATARFTDDVDRFSQTVFRGGVGYRLSKRVSVMAGYTHVQSRPHSPSDLEGLFEQVQWSAGKVAGFDLTTLTRLEEFWTEAGSDTAFRLRQSFRFKRPLGHDGSPSLVLDASVYAQLVETDWGTEDGFDQLRLYAALSLPVSRHVDLEVGYLNRYADRSPRDRDDHIGTARMLAHF